MLAHFADESDKNLPVSRRRFDTGSTEQIRQILKEGGSFFAPIPITITCELEGQKWAETLIKGVDERWKEFWRVTRMTK